MKKKLELCIVILKYKNMALREEVFALQVATRDKLLTYLENVSAEGLAQIPEGFHNNMWWNIAHCVAQQQILCYRLSGGKPAVDEEFIETYKKGTYPDGHIPTAEEIQKLRALLISSAKQLQADYERGVFENFTPYTTSYGYALGCIEDAINFNNAHEAMHLGVVIALNYFAK